MSVPIITPAGPLARDGKSLTDFTSDQAVTWATTGGTLSLVLAQSVRWEAPNKQGVWQVSGDNGPDAPGVVLITVKAILPNYYDYKIPVHGKKDVLAFRPLIGPTQTRGFGGSPVIRDWEIASDDLDYDKFWEFFAFWDYHYPGRQFDHINPNHTERRTYEFDSNLDWQENDSNGYTFSVRMKEVYPYVST